MQIQQTEKFVIIIYRLFCLKEELISYQIYIRMPKTPNERVDSVDIQCRAEFGTAKAVGLVVHRLAGYTAALQVVAGLLPFDTLLHFDSAEHTQAWRLWSEICSKREYQKRGKRCKAT